MSGEHQAIEKKSLSLVGTKADVHEIAKECVGMANARGGHIFILTKKRHITLKCLIVFSRFLSNTVISDLNTKFTY